MKGQYYQSIGNYLTVNNYKMEFKAIKIELFKEDEQPQFNIDDFQTENQSNKNDSSHIITPLNKKQSLPSSIMSQISNPSKSHVSSILYSPEKQILNELKRKQTGFQSISPLKSLQRNKATLKRPIFSAMKYNNSKTIPRQETPFGRTSYTPSLSPQKKSLYSQPWLISMNSTVRQSASQEVPKVTAQSFCVMCTQTNQILACDNLDTQRQIASLTKLMTAYTALSICSSFGIKIRQYYVCINKQAAWMNGTSAGLKIDQQVLMIDLLYAMLLPSGNDAGVALAQYFGKFLSFKFAQDGSNERVKNSLQKFREFKDFYDTEYDKDSLRLFVFQMNKNAHKIGLKNTHFNNPTGLSDKNNYSTARDMAFFTSHCLNNHTLRMIFKKKFHSCDVLNKKMSYSRQVIWKNTNRHLFQFRQCIGIKTGITPNAGPCLSSAYKVMGKQIVIIVLQCQSVQARYKDAQALFKWSRKKIRAL